MSGPLWETIPAVAAGRVTGVPKNQQTHWLQNGLLANARTIADVVAALAPDA